MAALLLLVVGQQRPVSSMHSATRVQSGSHLLLPLSNQQQARPMGTTRGSTPTSSSNSSNPSRLYQQQQGRQEKGQQQHRLQQQQQVVALLTHQRQARV